MFSSLHTKFEKKDTDLHLLEQEKDFSKYILIRSLDTESLKKAIKIATEEEAISSTQDDLYEELFNTDITISLLVNLIGQFYPSVKQQRMEQEKHLPDVIKNFGTVKCGIRNDNMNDVAKALVRDKTIATKEELDKRVDTLLEGTIKGYILWQYYNQVTNDLIEHIVNDHPNVIPTIRKIHDIDFFIKQGDKIIPFDLKITHISNDFFDMYSKGVVPFSENTDTFKCIENDDFCISTDGKTELEQIKSLYKKIKKEYDLPNIGQQNKESLIMNLSSLSEQDILTKAKNFNSIKELKGYYQEIKATFGLPNMSSLSRDEMIEIAMENNEPATRKLLSTLISKRQECIESLTTNRKVLEWWNYKYQGERLFKNNNRFFVFLAYTNSFKDARPLKGDVEELKKVINTELNSICDKSKLNTIKYYYSKDKNRKGAYKILSTSAIYIK